jgi:hypothetical protein
MSSKWMLLVVGTLVVIFGFLLALGSIVAQIPICTQGGECARYDYLAAAGGIAVGIVVASGGGWIINSGRRAE